ncbi:MAG: alanine racemase [Bacteroidetes bacterium MedPE-SWsnd-G2]|nr:MAG: alanine racemase [Bacteroidetes bacterium MedPE-SWsnd-G2]
MPKAKETILEIDLNALEHNYRYLKSKLKSNTKFLAVVKAFAYGSDAQAIAKHLETIGVDYFAVAYTDEGVALRNAGITTPILVLHPQPSNFSTLIERCLEPSIYSPKVLKAFKEVAIRKHQNAYPIHLKFNTGLNRLGFWENDIDFILSELNLEKSLLVKSIFSHFAASEDPNETEFSKAQLATFNSISNHITEALEIAPWKHMCNTSGILNYPEAHFDMVRCGIGLYGFGNSKSENKNLKPIAALKSIISQIHQIEPGESVGYNRAFKSESFETTATIPIGHADGISRQFGQQKGYVFINGKKAPIIGNVCMDMIMVKITGIDCNEGDEVILFDHQFTAEDLAEKANTISYELLTAISQRVKRVFTSS